MYTTGTWCVTTFLFRTKHLPTAGNATLAEHSVSAVTTASSPHPHLVVGVVLFALTFVYIHNCSSRTPILCVDAGLCLYATWYSLSITYPVSLVYPNQVLY